MIPPGAREIRDPEGEIERLSAARADTRARRKCGTCQRWRLYEDFMLPESPSQRNAAGICRSCRVKLWDNPDDPDEPEGWRG